MYLCPGNWFRLPPSATLRKLRRSRLRSRKRSEMPPDLPLDAVRLCICCLACFVSPGCCFHCTLQAYRQPQYRVLFWHSRLPRRLPRLSCPFHCDNVVRLRFRPPHPPPRPPSLPSSAGSSPSAAPAVAALTPGISDLITHVAALQSQLDEALKQ